MSVLIKGMDMPTCCADCDIHNPFSETPYCRRLLQVIPLEGRLENCPLGEVPTPHGRLIDADIVMNVIANMMPSWMSSLRLFFRRNPFCDTASPF